MTRAALAVVVLVLVVSTGAKVRADDSIVLPRTKAVLELPPGWKQLDATALVAAYRSSNGLVLAITRAQIPNFDAWRDKTREAYADQIERGAVGAAPGQRRLARKLRDAGGVPALDLEIRRSDGTTLVVRTLLFRSYTLALAIEVPRGVTLDEARRVAMKFAPPKA
ncbi:MAG: hypothetical protein H6Q90_1100 [Deltaproteobacteria bacterium]|nr:hypothetical protein [Deltaproteobacteria bacterium]